MGSVGPSLRRRGKLLGVSVRALPGGGRVGAGRHPRSVSLTVTYLHPFQDISKGLRKASCHRLFSGNPNAAMNSGGVHAAGEGERTQDQRKGCKGLVSSSGVEAAPKEVSTSVCLTHAAAAGHVELSIPPV